MHLLSLLFGLFRRSSSAPAQPVPAPAAPCCAWCGHAFDENERRPNLGDSGSTSSAQVYLIPQICCWCFTPGNFTDRPVSRVHAEFPAEGLAWTKWIQRESWRTVKHNSLAGVEPATRLALDEDSGAVIFVPQDETAGVSPLEEIANGPGASETEEDFNDRISANELMRLVCEQNRVVARLLREAKEASYWSKREHIVTAKKTEALALSRESDRWLQEATELNQRIARRRKEREERTAEELEAELAAVRARPAGPELTQVNWDSQKIRALEVALAKKKAERVKLRPKDLDPEEGVTGFLPVAVLQTQLIGDGTTSEIHLPKAVSL